MKWIVRKTKCAKPRKRTLISKAQKSIARKHGTPAAFACAVLNAVPGDISIDEAAAAISKYNREWVMSGRNNF